MEQMPKVDQLHQILSEGAQVHVVIPKNRDSK